MSGNKTDTERNQTAIDSALARAKAGNVSLSSLSQSYGNTGKQDFKDQLLSKLSPLLDTTDTALNVVERPAQAILHGLQQFSGQGLNSLNPSTIAKAGKAFGKGFTDVKGEDNLNLRGTLNQDPNAGGKWAAVFDTLGTAAIDPLTYIGGGTSAAGRAGLKVIEEKTGKDVAEQVGKHGFNSLPAEQQATVRNALAEHEAESGAKGFTDKVLGNGLFKAGALEDGAGLKWAGKTVLKKETVRPIAEAAKLPEINKAVQNTAAMKLVRQAFVPFEKVSQLPGYGKDVVDKIEGTLRRGRASGDNAAQDVLTQTRTAIKESKVKLSDFQDGVPKTQEARDLLEHVKGLQKNAEGDLGRATGQDISTDGTVLKYLSDLEKVNPSKVVRVGTEQQEHLPLGLTAEIKPIARPAETAGDQHLPGMLDTAHEVAVPEHRFTVKGGGPEVSKTLQAFEGHSAGQSSLMDSPAKTRVFTQEALKAVNNNQTAIAKALKLDVHASPSAIMDHLQKALPNVPLPEANTRLSDIVGVKNVFKTNPLEAATDITIKAHRDAAVADTLKGLSTIKNEFDEPVLLRDVEGPGGDAIRLQAKKLGYQEANTVLGHIYAPKEIIRELEHASVALTDDHALSTLNEMLDKWAKLWRGYATVPVLFGAGFHERNLVGNVFNMWLGGFRNVGLFRTSEKIGRALESGVNSGLSADAAIDAAKSLSPEERHWIRLARQEGVIGDSFFRTDLSTQVKGSFKDASLGGKIDKVVGTQGPLIRSGAYVGRRIEDNSRLAMFIDQMKKHGDPDIAAREVKKYLFDYSELTPTEKAIKKIVPFYTFTRKNTPLQLQAMLQTPGKFSDLAHFRDNMQAGETDTNGKPIPQYALQNGAIPLFGGKTPIVGSFNTPFQAAMQQIQPLLELASQTPGTPKDLRTEGGSGKAFREALGNFGGGPLDVGKFAVEQATGNSLLTGNKVKPGTADQRLLKALVPLYGKGDSTITDIASSDPAVRNARLLSALTGLSANAITDKAAAGETARRTENLQSQIVGTPTVADLRKQGKMPKAHTTHKAKTKKAATLKSPLAKKPSKKKTV